MRKTLFFCFLIPFALAAQEKGYYYEIPDYPEAYTGPNVAARLVDGLGFRYYWATDQLRAEDMNYKPSPDARTTYETLVHIHGLTRILKNAVTKTPTDFSIEQDSLPYTQLIKETLEFIKAASEKLKTSTAEDLSSYNMVFVRGDAKTEYPFWNLVNGPISDAIWHVGQVVSFRRGSGNPLNPKASMLQGKVRE